LSWPGGGGDVVVELDVNITDWLEIIGCEEVTLDGQGYFYDGEPFQDRWHFSGGLEGDLRVTYESRLSPGDPGDGWLGAPRRALVRVAKRFPNISAQEYDEIERRN
jgi:hypothetical protein